MQYTQAIKSLTHQKGTERDLMDSVNTRTHYINFNSILIHDIFPIFFCNKYDCVWQCFKNIHHVNGKNFWSKSEPVWKILRNYYIQSCTSLLIFLIYGELQKQQIRVTHSGKTWAYVHVTTNKELLFCQISVTVTQGTLSILLTVWYQTLLNIHRNILKAFF